MDLVDHRLHRERGCFLAALALASIAGVALRTWGITSQVVLDDEWHAIHKLQAHWWSIFGSFGWSDHSIPLTLFYKAMASVAGLTEGRIRALQVLSGIALVPFAGWLAWRATGDRAAAALLAVLVAFSPFLVLWSRFARPYAITLLLAVACVASAWAWRARRSRGLAWAVIGTGALTAWLHPISALYPAIACLFVFLEDALAQRQVRSHAARQSFRLGMATAAAMAALLVVPLVRDHRSLSAKSGGDFPDLQTYERMLAIFWGGIPTPAIAVATALSAAGFGVLVTRDRRLALFLAALASIPPLVVSLIGATWVHEGQNLARYVLPLQPILLFTASLGLVSLVRTAAAWRGGLAAWVTAAAASLAFAIAVPTVEQVARLGTWYGHLDYHWDYRVRNNDAKRRDAAYTLPAFYEKLSHLPPGTVPIIEAPFAHEAPFNSLAFYATFHHQPERFGMLRDVCRPDKREGEVPFHDPRFRFRMFVFLQDVEAVRRSGARYLVFERRDPHGRPFPESDRCLAALERLYGAPSEIDERVAAFDLQAPLRLDDR
jgi:hypothetical protein